MAVNKTNYGSKTTISPFHVRIRKDSASIEIVIEDINPGFTSSQRASINRDEVWVAIEADYTVTVLSAVPNSSTFLDQYNTLTQSLVKIKGGEVFVTEHSTTNPADNNQTAVTGYSFGTFDTVYLKIDRVANTISVYQAPDNA